MFWITKKKDLEKRIKTLENMLGAKQGGHSDYSFCASTINDRSPSSLRDDITSTRKVLLGMNSDFELLLEYLKVRLTDVPGSRIVESSCESKKSSKR